MQAILLIGIQASGKSTFYRERFADTHIRINLDMLRTRHRETRLFELCLEIQQSFVIDNTNVTIEDRARYIKRLSDFDIKAIGYYFQSEVNVCKERNADREESKRIPVTGILGTYTKLQLPTFNEGFSELHYVSIDESGQFLVSGWNSQ